jgi:amino acid transporter
MKQPLAGQAADSTAPVPLKRVLSLGDLTFYGIVLIQPIAPVGIFGVAAVISRGHVSTTIVLAMAAMSLTAFSYGRMATLYPVAGSAYTYVGHGLNAHLGFLAGWVMLLDYLIIPVLNVVYVGLTLHRVLPQVPFSIWVGLTVAALTLLNLLGIRFAAVANQALLALMTVVIAAFAVRSVRFLLLQQGWGGLFSLQPFYDPATFSFGSLATSTSLAALTYIGFDGVTTLADEAREPRRTVPLATVLVCLITGLLSTLEVYLAQRVWPDYRTFPNTETAFLDVCGRVGGDWLFQAMAAILVVACFGSGLAGQVGAARLLYALGRDRVLPPRVFAYVNRRSGAPVVNIILVGALALGGAFALSYERAASLLNFGAFLAFMGVNLAAIRQYCFRSSENRSGRWRDLIFPGLGFLFCLSIWMSLPLPAKIAGGAWLTAGVVYQAVQTRGFRRPPPKLDLRDTG